MFVVDKTLLIWKCVTCKVFFMYRIWILAEYEHHMIMSLRFPSDFKFLWGGHFSGFFGENLEFQKKSIWFSKLSKFWNFWKFNYPQSIEFLSIISHFWMDLIVFLKNVFLVGNKNISLTFIFFEIFIFLAVFFCVIEFIQKAIYSNV